MRGVVADENYGGQLERVQRVLLSPFWRDMWLSYGLTIETFHALGLGPKTNDRVVWERCQAERLILFTGNRNAHGPDSLELAIRAGPADALPVFTVADGDRLMRDFDFAKSVASDMMDTIDDLTFRPETILGSGRIYLPQEIRSV